MGGWPTEWLERATSTLVLGGGCHWELNFDMLEGENIQLKVYTRPWRAPFTRPKKQINIFKSKDAQPKIYTPLHLPLEGILFLTRFSR